jgi:hypothetical protein
MAAPNLRLPTTIIGKTATYSCTTSLASALANSAASSKVLKVNTLRATSVSAVSASLEVTFFRSATHSYIIKNVSISPGTFLVIIDKNEYIYLEEGDAIYAKASAASSIDITINYEDIS